MIIVVLALILLAGCGSRNAGEATPTRLNLTQSPTARQPARANSSEQGESGVSASSTPRPPTPTVAPIAVSTPLAADQTAPTILTGFLATTVPVYLLPDADSEVLGELEAGQLVIVTGTRDDWYQVIYGQARRGHAWLPRDAIDLTTPTPRPVRGGEAGTPTAPAVAETTTPQPAASPEATAEKPGGTVLAARLNVRSGPGTDHEILGQLRQGDRVEIVDRASGWLHIVYPAGPDGMAWVSAAYVAVDGEPLPTLPPVAGLPGRLVFQNRNGGDIYIMNADGSGLRRLTQGGFEPAFSPDGRQIAYARWDEPRGIWIMNADGSNQHLFYGANEPRSPTWSPDGKAIVLQRNTGSHNCRSTPFGCLTDGELRNYFGGQDCMETPFGRYCINDFRVVSEPLSGLTRVDLTDGSTRDLPASSSAAAPSYHPLDGRVLFLDRDGLATTRDSGDGSPQRVVELPTMLGAGIYSPDGRYIFSSRRSGDSWNIWRWNADGSQEVALTAPPGIRSGPMHSVAPAISPDGRYIAFLSNRRGRWEMWVMNVDGSNQRPLAPAALADIEFDYTFSSERMIDWGE